MSVDPVNQPGALYIGGMGSGKSIAARFTILTRLFSNSEHDLYVLVDPVKAMSDYACMFPLKDNVVTALSSPAKVVPVIDMVHAEMMERKDEFAKENANSIYSYEDAIRKKDPNFKLARIFLCMEEFHSIPNSEYVKFSYKCDTPGTTASKLKDISRIGRSYGITMIAATQRCTPDDFPSTLKPGITMLMAFRVNNPGDAAAANLPMAADIGMDQKGRCCYEGGMIQFPYIKDDPANELIKRFYKPLSAKLLRYQVQDYHKALSGDGNDGMVWVKPYKDILQNIQEYNPIEVYTRFLTSFDFKVKKQENGALSVNLIAERDGIRYAVLCILSRSQASEKSIMSFKDGAAVLDCDGAIAISSEAISSSVSSQLKSFQSHYIADGEDLMRISETLDNKKKFVNESDFQRLYSKLVFVKRGIHRDKSDDQPSDDGDLDEEFEALRKKILS